MSICHAAHHRLSRLWITCTAGLLLASSAFAGDHTKDLSTPAIEQPAWRIHSLLNLEFTTDYISPQGVHVENQGLVFEPLFILFTTLYQDKDPAGLLQNVGLTTGVWNTIHQHRSGYRPNNLNETTPIAGLSFQTAKGFEFDATFTTLYSQTNSYDACNNLSLKLSYSDKIFGETFSINPYVEYWRELTGKSTVVFNTFNSTQSWYFSIGMNPTLKFKTFPVEFSLPTYVNIVENDFYQRFNGQAAGGGVAFLSTELKASLPLKAIPEKFGHWSVYTGYQFYHMDNTGLLDGNQAINATSERLHNLWQVHGGLSVFF